MDVGFAWIEWSRRYLLGCRLAHGIMTEYDAKTMSHTSSMCAMCMWYELASASDHHTPRMRQIERERERNKKKVIIPSPAPFIHFHSSIHPSISQYSHDDSISLLLLSPLLFFQFSHLKYKKKERFQCAHSGVYHSLSVEHQSTMDHFTWWERERQREFIVSWSKWFDLVKMHSEGPKPSYESVCFACFVCCLRPLIPSTTTAIVWAEQIISTFQTVRWTQPLTSNWMSQNAPLDIRYLSVQTADVCQVVWGCV